MTCTPCIHNRLHGWWGPDHRGTHCGDNPHRTACHRSWTGLTEAHCYRCHQHFTSDRVADLHWQYCLEGPTTVAERLPILARKDGNPLFDLRERASGSVWVEWRADPHPFAVAS